MEWASTRMGPRFSVKRQAVCGLQARKNPAGEPAGYEVWERMPERPHCSAATQYISQVRKRHRALQKLQSSYLIDLTCHYGSTSFLQPAAPHHFAFRARDDKARARP
jgi:hypothetical protein